MADRETSERRVDRRDMLEAAGTGAATVALTGCKERANTPTPSPRASVDDDGPLAGKKYRFGVLAPTPKSFPVGTSMVRSAELAAQDINANGGIAGAEVEIFVGNTEASPGTGREEFIRLIKQQGIDAAFGTFLTQVTLQCFQPMSQFRTPLVGTAAAGPKPTRVVSKQYDKYKYFFRAGPLNSYDLAKAELEFLNLYAEKLGWEKVAPLIENIGPFDPFAELLGENLAGTPVEVVATGGKNQTVRRTSSGTTNWTPIWDEVENADADLALVAQALTGTAAIKQWFNQKRQFEMGGINVPSQVYEFWEEVGGACQYVFTMNAVTPQTTNTKRTQPFMNRYRKQFDTYPVYSGPITYDAMMATAQTIENHVEKTGKTKKPDPDSLVPVIEDTSYTDGVIMPKFQFTPPSAKYAHDPKWSSMKETGVPVWQQWQKDPKVKTDYGTMHAFAPEQNQSAPYAYPEWIDYPSDHPATEQ